MPRRQDRDQHDLPRLAEAARDAPSVQGRIGDRLVAESHARDLDLELRDRGEVTLRRAADHVLRRTAGPTWRGSRFSSALGPTPMPRRARPPAPPTPAVPDP